MIIDLHCDEINRIVSKRVYIYISSYRISVSPPPSLLSFFDSQRLQAAKIMLNILDEGQSTRQHFLTAVEFIMQSNDAIYLEEVLNMSFASRLIDDWVNWVIYDVKKCQDV